MRWTIVLILALVLVTVSAGCLGDSGETERDLNDSTEDEDPSWTTYENEQWGFAVDHPESWTVEVVEESTTPSDEALHIDDLDRFRPEDVDRLRQRARVRFTPADRNDTDVRVTVEQTGGTETAEAGDLYTMVSNEDVPRLGPVERSEVRGGTAAFWAVGSDGIRSEYYVDVVDLPANDTFTGRLGRKRIAVENESVEIRARAPAARFDATWNATLGRLVTSIRASG